MKKRSYDRVIIYYEDIFQSYHLLFRLQAIASCDSLK